MRTSPSSRSRDIALRRLARCNRWLLAGSATLTGVFTVLAAQAFPGKTRASTPANDAGTSAKTSRAREQAPDAHTTHAVSPAKALKSPAQAPKAASSTTQTTHTDEAQTTATEQATPTESTTTAETQAATPTETAKTTETQTPSSSTAESSSSSSESTSPVVSGGS